MGYHDHDESTPPGSTRAGMIASVLVRTMGIALLVAGLVLAALVIIEVWALYKHPERIEAFAAAVEQGSNIDKTLAPRRTGEGLGDLSLGADAGAPDTSIRLSYFFAWFIVFVLMLLLTRIAISVASTGGRLALYDLEVKRLAKALVEQSAKAYR